MVISLVTLIEEDQRVNFLTRHLIHMSTTCIVVSREIVALLKVADRLGKVIVVVSGL